MSDIQMRGPKGCGNTLSFGGDTYTAKKGIFTVPAQAESILRRHGFTVAALEVAAPVDDDETAAPIAAADKRRSKS